MNTVTTEINGKNYTFNIKVLQVQVDSYDGWDQADFKVTALIRCGKIKKSVECVLTYAVGSVSEYYRDQDDYSQLAEDYLVDEEEIDEDFDNFFEENEEQLTNDYFDLFINDVIYDDVELDTIIIDYMNDEKNGLKDDLLELISNDDDDDDEIKTIYPDCDCFVPYYGISNKEKFKKLPEQMQLLTHDEKTEITLKVNKLKTLKVKMYITKYQAYNCCVGAFGDFDIECDVVGEMLRIFIKHEKIKTVGDLKDYLKNNDNEIVLKFYGDFESIYCK